MRTGRGAAATKAFSTFVSTNNLLGSADHFVNLPSFERYVNGGDNRTTTLTCGRYRSRGDEEGEEGRNAELHFMFVR